MDYVKPHVDGLLQAALPWTEDRLALFLGLALASAVGSVLFVLLLCFYNYYLHPIAHIKGPFLASISPLFLVRSVAGARLNPDIKALHRKYGPVVRVAPNELSFDTEQAIKDIHHPAPHVGKFTKRGTSEDLIRVLTFAEENLLTVDDGPDHKRLRNVLAPAFTAKAMREQETITQYHANKAVENLAKAAAEPSRVVNLTYEINKMVWGNVGNLCFGEPVPFEHLDHHEASKHIYGKVAPYLEFFCYVNSFPVVKSITVAVVASARKMFGLSGNILGRAQLERHIAHQDGQKNFLTAILESKEAIGLSTGDIHSNMLLLLMGGYESSAVTLSALFYYLLNNRVYYERLKAEVRAQFGSVDDVDCTKVLQMPMLNACLNEALRLVPAFNGHSTHRVAATACVVDGVPVPAGVQVSADFYSVHRNPRYFARPDEFHPERWLPEGRAAGSPFANDVLTASRPFGMGARVCIGREMSLHAMRLDLAKIVFATDLTLANPEFVWDRDVSSHYMWYGHEVLVHVQKPAAA